MIMYYGFITLSDYYKVTMDVNQSRNLKRARCSVNQVKSELKWDSEKESYNRWMKNKLGVKRHV